jgi:Protein of unknown function, DUF547
MMDRRTTIALLASAAGLVFGAKGRAQAADPHAAFDALLARYVSAHRDGVNRVDYGRWKATSADRAALDTYITTLAAQAPSTLPRDEAFAYWSNLYNALAIRLVLDNYPLSVLQDITAEPNPAGVSPSAAYTDPWKHPRVVVEGRLLSMDTIENEIMRPKFNDPRLHYVLNCTSYGRPSLMARAWRAPTLEADLESAARTFINHDRGVTVRPDGKLVVSSLYTWFIADFGGDQAGIIKHLRRYARPELDARLAAGATIAEDTYEWELNDVAYQRK